MANIAALLKRIESGTLSYEEKLSALSQVEQSLQDMRQKKQEAIQSNVMLIVDALKQMQVKVEQQLEEAKAIVPQKGQKGDKGDKGDRGLDGAPGKDGRNGIDGKDGKDGNDGISVTDAKIDFDGSLVITLSNGREINVGEVLPLEVSDKIKVIANGGGTSQTVVDTLTSLQNQINTLTGVDGVLGDMAQQNANNVAITGGAIDGATIGGVTPAAGTFTTLTATGQTSLGGVAGSESLRVLTPSVVGARLDIQSFAGSTQLSGEASTGVVDVVLNSRSSGSVRFRTAGGTEQARVSHTASAVNYVQMTGGATGNNTTISTQGSDGSIGLTVLTRGTSATGSLVSFASNLTQTNYTFRIAAGSTANANYLQVAPAATTASPVLSAQGSDTNISQVFQSKGTGAIDLAAGSSGVNISNGGTVTALTRTATGSAYTGFPSVAITAPTTAGGVQATASAQLVAGAAAVAGGGTGYTNGDTLTVSGGSSSFTITVTGVTGGVITSATTSSVALTSIPSNPVSVTGGTGTGATFNITYGIAGTFTITNAGSGYVEQPTVTFSGGGGSGAAAYASVGATTTIKGLYGGGSQIPLQFAGPAGNILQLMESGTASPLVPLVIKSGGSSTQMYPNGTNIPLQFSSSGTGGLNFYTGTLANEQFRIANTSSAVNYVQVTGAATTGTPIISAQGSDTNAGIRFYSKGAAGFSFWTNGGSSRQFVVEHTGGTVVNYLQVTGNSTTNSPILSAQGSDTNIDLTLTTKGTGAVNAITGGGTQFKVSNTASAVNYVQVTGAATTIRPAITAQGSDTNIGLSVYTKGTGQVVFGNGGQFAQFRINGAVNAVNYLQVDGSLTGAAPVLSALGSDTNIDLALTPKGTGVVQFGTYTATVTAVAGYIQIKDAGGTLRKLAVLT